MGVGFHPIPIRTLGTRGSEVQPQVFLVNASGTALAGAQNQVALTARNRWRNFLTGLTVTTAPPASGTVPLVGLVTITDGTWTENYYLTETITAGGWLNKSFNPVPLAASAQNVAITVTLAAIANGGISAISLEGYYQ